MKRWMKAIASAAMVCTLALGAAAFASCGVSENTDPASLRSEKVTAETWSKTVEETSENLKSGINFSMKMISSKSETKDDKTTTTSVAAVVKISETVAYYGGERTADGKTEKVGTYFGVETTDDTTTIFSYVQQDDEWKKNSVSVTSTSLKDFLRSDKSDVDMSYVKDEATKYLTKFDDFEYSKEDKGYVNSISVNTDTLKLEVKAIVKFSGGKLAYSGYELSANNYSVSWGVLFFDIGTTKISLPKV